MCKGFMRVSREKVSDFEWLDNPTICYCFFRLLFKANYKDGRWQGIEVKRGQLLTGRKSLSDELNLTERQIRTCLEKLTTTGYIDQQTTNKYTIITICNYDSWQDENNMSDQQNVTQTTNKRPTNDQQTTTIEISKEIEELKKENERLKEELANASKKKAKSFVPPTVEEVSEFVREQGFHFDAIAFVNFYESKGWLVGKNKMKDWKAACRTWEQKRSENLFAPQSREDIGVILYGNNTGKYDNISEDEWNNGR